MRERLVRRTRSVSAIAASTALVVGAIVSLNLAQTGANAMPFAPVLSADTVAIATGGGTIYTNPAQTAIASFGINGKRPANFASGQGGAALGRINFDDHVNIAGRHLNVAVTYMLAEIANPQTGNQTGGHAQLIGDCTQPNAECSGGPAGTQSVIADVTDNSDSGAGHDTITITYCSSSAQQTVTNPLCFGQAFSGTLRTGNIQIRVNLSSSGGTAPTAARAPLRLPSK